MGDEAPRFVCDEMLGKLARSLRLLGYDVLYPKGARDDAEVARLALEGDRILLTRDVALASRVPRGFLLRTKDSEEQLAEVVAAFGLDLCSGQAFSRCSLCNTPLAPLAAEAAAGRVPPEVLARHRVFHACPTCGRVYWEGTHVEAMRRRLRLRTGDSEREPA